MSKRTVIVSGGMLEEDFVLPILKDEDTEFIIGVDSCPTSMTLPKEEIKLYHCQVSRF